MLTAKLLFFFYYLYRVSWRVLPRRCGRQFARFRGMRLRTARISATDREQSVRQCCDAIDTVVYLLWFVLPKRFVIFVGACAICFVLKWLVMKSK